MKKFILLFMCAFSFMSCDVEDDGPNFEQVLVEVVDHDLPEVFEQGKVYTINITYLLPDACHVGLGLQAVRGAFDGDARRDIYVAGVASRPIGQGECTLEDDDLEREEYFIIRADESRPYTFYLWTGLDENQESVYTEIEIPVVPPATSTPD